MCTYTSRGQHASPLAGVYSEILMICKQKLGTKIILVVDSRRCFCLQPTPINTIPGHITESGMISSKGEFEWNDPQMVLTQQPWTSHFALSLHIFTQCGLLYEYSILINLAEYCSRAGSQQNVKIHILTEPYFLLKSKMFNTSLTTSCRHDRPPLWSSGQSFWLQIQRSRVRFLALPDSLSSSGSGTGSTQPREVNWGATWIKSRGSGPENRD